MNASRSAVIIGAGISGLACAWRLRKYGIPVTLLEETSRVGGVVGSFLQNGFLFEKGPQSFLGTPAILDLVRELGIESELVSGDPRAARYILRGGRLHRVPLSPQSFFTSSFFSGGTRLRAAAELLRRSRPPQPRPPRSPSTRKRPRPGRGRSPRACGRSRAITSYRIFASPPVRRCRRCACMSRPWARRAATSTAG